MTKRKTFRVDLTLIDMPGMKIEAEGIYDATFGILMAVQMPHGKRLYVDQVEAGFRALGIHDDKWKRQLRPPV